MKFITFEQAKQYGFIFPGARAWIDNQNINALAQDAALVTTPNTTVPAEFLFYYDPLVIEILTAPRKAREILPEEKKGDWTTPYEKWRMDEFVGKTQPYDDFANGTTSNVNFEWATREQYVFQTTIQYGDFEVARSGVARIELASSKQKAAASIIDIDSNKFAMLGIANKNIYGIVNDPNLLPAIVASPTGTGGSTLWNDKTTAQIYDDILLLFEELSKQSQGLIDASSPLKLCLSPSMNVKLGAATDFNVSVLDMIRKYFSSISIITVPELGSLPSGETAMLLAEHVNGQPVGYIGYSEKFMAGRIIPELSSFSQKFVSTTYGAVILQPFAVAQMTGI